MHPANLLSGNVPWWAIFLIIILLCLTPDGFTCEGERATTEENQSLSLKCIENRDQIITLLKQKLLKKD
jgi:hypothetical protein